jgi:hypothetical protein
MAEIQETLVLWLKVFLCVWEISVNKSLPTISKQPLLFNSIKCKLPQTHTRRNTVTRMKGDMQMSRILLNYNGLWKHIWLQLHYQATRRSTDHILSTLGLYE